VEAFADAVGLRAPRLGSKRRLTAALRG
jgi:hypothetical protein